MQRRSLVSAALAAGLLFAAAGCADSDAKSSSGAAASTLKIGFLGSLTGTYQAVGTDLKSGFELYLATHDNKLGGHPIDLKIADEGDGAPTAVPAATKLIKDDKVVALTGIVGGGSVAAVAPLLAEAKIPLIGSNGRPDLKDLSGVWTTSFMSTDTGKSIAQYIKDKVNGPVYAIGPDYQGGYDQVGGFTTEFLKLGGTLVNGKATFTPFPTTTNFLPFFSQIKASNAKAVYTFYAGKAAIDFVKQYAQSDAKDIPLYSAGFLTEGSVLQAQGDAAKNILNVCNYSPDLDNEAEPQVRRRLAPEAPGRDAHHVRDGVLRRGRGPRPRDRGGRREPDPRVDQRRGRQARPDPLAAWQLAVRPADPLAHPEVVPAAGPQRRPGPRQRHGAGPRDGRCLTELDAYLIPAVDGVAYGLLLFVVAAGLTLAFGVGDVLNLAHGTLFAFGAYAAAKISDGTWLSLALAVLVGTATAAAGGAVLSALLVPLAGRGHLAQALLTFGVALVVGDLLVGIFGPDDLPVTVPAVLDRPVDIAGHSYPGYRLAFIGVAALSRPGCTSSSPGPGSAASCGPPSTTATWSPRWASTRSWCAPASSPRAAPSPGSPARSGPRSSGPGPAPATWCSAVAGRGGAGWARLDRRRAGRRDRGRRDPDPRGDLGGDPGLAPFLLFGAMAVVLSARARGLLTSGRSAT